MNQESICPVCHSKAPFSFDSNKDLVFYSCPICGRFELYHCEKDANPISNKIAPYLFYNRFLHSNIGDVRYHTVRSKEECDIYQLKYKNGQNIIGFPVHMDSTIIDNWYPKTFAERIDKILLCIYGLTNHIGQFIEFKKAEVFSLLFIDRYEKTNSFITKTGDYAEFRGESDLCQEANFMLDYFANSNLLLTTHNSSWESTVHVALAPQGYNRVDELQKIISKGHNALVAMKFGKETKVLREAIREGITNAGYNAIFIDEVEHINFITPELMKYIRDSKFVVVDLTHQNNGAYFEEGYAMGLGKPVIQLCKEDVKLHFDIAQKNTIIWKTEDDIPQRLTNRIKATID